jgi:hypothetical protein
MVREMEGFVDNLNQMLIKGSAFTKNMDDINDIKGLEHFCTLFEIVSV